MNTLMLKPSGTFSGKQNWEVAGWNPQHDNTLGVPRGSVVKCLTYIPAVLGLSHTRSSGFFCGTVLGQHTSEPRPSTGETQERHEYCELSL